MSAAAGALAVGWARALPPGWRVVVDAESFPARLAALAPWASDAAIAGASHGVALALAAGGTVVSGGGVRLRAYERGRAAHHGVAPRGCWLWPDAPAARPGVCADGRAVYLRVHSHVVGGAAAVVLRAADAADAGEGFGEEHTVADVRAVAAVTLLRAPGAGGVWGFAVHMRPGAFVEWPPCALRAASGARVVMFECDAPSACAWALALSACIDVAARCVNAAHGGVSAAAAAAHAARFDVAPPPTPPAGERPPPPPPALLLPLGGADARTEASAAGSWVPGEDCAGGSAEAVAAGAAGAPPVLRALCRRLVAVARVASAHAGGTTRHAVDADARLARAERFAATLARCGLQDAAVEFLGAPAPHRGARACAVRAQPPGRTPLTLRRAAGWHRRVYGEASARRVRGGGGDGHRA